MDFRGSSRPRSISARIRSALVAVYEECGHGVVAAELGGGPPILCSDIVVAVMLLSEVQANDVVRAGLAETVLVLCGDGVVGRCRHPLQRAHARLVEEQAGEW